MSTMGPRANVMVETLRAQAGPTGSSIIAERYLSTCQSSKQSKLSLKFQRIKMHKLRLCNKCF